MRRNDGWEYATEAAPECTARIVRGSGRARSFSPLMAREIRLIQAGGRQCARCGRDEARVPVGTPWELQAVCRPCAAARTPLERRQRLLDIARGAR
jgi:hypothetical protein